MTPRSTLAVTDLAPEVLTFAAEKGVTDCLPALMHLVQRIFPNRPLQIVVVDDPELSYNRSIAFRVDVGNMDPNECYVATSKWYNGLFASCPATHVHAFELDTVFSS